MVRQLWTPLRFITVTHNAPRKVTQIKSVCLILGVLVTKVLKFMIKGEARSPKEKH